MHGASVRQRHAVLGAARPTPGRRSRTGPPRASRQWPRAASPRHGQPLTELTRIATLRSRGAGDGVDEPVGPLGDVGVPVGEARYERRVHHRGDRRSEPARTVRSSRIMVPDQPPRMVSVMPGERRSRSSSRSWTKVSSHASGGTGRSAMVRRELAATSERVVRADELPAQHDALVGHEHEDLAVVAADVLALSVNVPAAVVPADALVDQRHNRTMSASEDRARPVPEPTARSRPRRRCCRTGSW